MDAIFISLALAMLALFGAASLVMAWATGPWGGLAFVALGAALWRATGGAGPRFSAHDPQFNALQQALSRKR